MCIILIDWLNVTIWLRKSRLKINLHLNEKFNDESLMWTEHTEYEEYKNCSCPRYSDISTTTHSAKYRLIIVIAKISRYIFFPILHTPSWGQQKLIQKKLKW